MSSWMRALRTIVIPAAALAMGLGMGGASPAQAARREGSAQVPAVVARVAPGAAGNRVAGAGSAAAGPVAAGTAAAGTTAAGTAAPGPVVGVVNLNTATVDELVALPGIGPAKAAAIVAWRKKNGPFKRLTDLMKVRGFGRKTLLRLKPYLTLTGPTTYRAGAAVCPR